MDKKLASNIILGAFLAMVLGSFIFILFNIGGGHGIFSSQFTLYGKFENIKGLHYGSEVSLSGLRIGVVKTIAITDPKSKELLVELSIVKKYQTYIRQDSAALLKTQGVLGDKFIEVSIGNPELPMMKNGDTIPTAQTNDIITKSGDLMEDIRKQFNKGGNVDSLLHHLNNVAENLDVMTSTIRREKGLAHEIVYGKSGENLGRSMQHLEGIMRKIDKGEGTIGALINDPTVYEDVKSLMGGAKRSSILKYFMRSFIESGEKAPAAEKKK